LPSLLAFARPGHVLYGSDWPFAPKFVITHFTTHLDGYEPLTPEQRRDIDHGGARHLFPPARRSKSGVTAVDR
jgi:6-methylsalicylate decarboxylase